MMHEEMSTLKPVLERIQRVSEELLQAAQQKQWDHFLELAQEREILFAEVEKQRKQLLGEKDAGVLQQLNRWVTAEFQKLSKVHEQIGDIIEEEKNRIFDGLLRTLKGREFLDLYRRSFSGRSTISKVY